MPCSNTSRASGCPAPTWIGKHIAGRNARFGDDKEKLKSRLKPLVKPLQNQSALKVIGQLEAAVAQAVEYFREHRERMDCRAGGRAGEPMGGGPLEAICRQAPCRFKRTDQFWSVKGDEALPGLETFWRNGRWHRLFPHTSFNPARN